MEQSKPIARPRPQVMTITDAAAARVQEIVSHRVEVFSFAAVEPGMPA